MERHRFGDIVQRVARGLPGADVDRIALGCGRQVDDRLCERVVALGHADEVDRVLGRHRDHQGLRVGDADVLGGEPDQPARDVERVLAGLHHSGQPIEGRVGVAVPHRLVQGGDEVVVLLAVLVVEERPTLRDQLDKRRVHAPASGVRARRRGEHGGFEEVQGSACVSAGETGHRVESGRLDVHGLGAQSAVPVRQSAPEDLDRGLERKRREDVDLRPRQQRRVHLERRILRRGADEHDVARLHPWQEGVLLSLVEPMNLVDEEDRSASHLPSGLLGLGHHRLDLLDAGEHGAECDEVGPRHLGDEAGESGLARAGRSPEDNRLQEVPLDRHPERTVRREQGILADEFLERPGPHAVRQRRLEAGGRRVVRVGEEVDVTHDRVLGTA